MFRYHAVIGVLLTSLLLASCGQNTAPNGAAQTLEPSKQVFQLERSEPGQLHTTEAIVASLPNFAGSTISFGTRPDSSQSFLRHIRSVINTTPFTSGTTDLTKQDSTWKVVPGLAGSVDNTCFSFESYNYPGYYMRHKLSRVRIDPRDGSSLFDRDATWCTRFSLDGGTAAGDQGVCTFESFNFSGRYLRNYNGEVWLTRKGGPLPSDNPTSFEQDASWGIYSPLIGY